MLVGLSLTGRSVELDHHICLRRRRGRFSALADSNSYELVVSADLQGICMR